MSTDGQGTKCRRNIAENFNRLSRVHELYRRQTDDRRQTDRQTTDGRAIAYSEREREFTFAKASFTIMNEPDTLFLISIAWQKNKKCSVK